MFIKKLLNLPRIVKDYILFIEMISKFRCQKILEYMPIPDDKIEQFKSLIKKTHGDPKWMKEHAKRTGIKSIDAFFADLPTGKAMIVVRDPAESLENWMKSDHPDDKGHLEEAMRIFGMTKEDLESSDQELKFEHVVSYQSS